MTVDNRKPLPADPGPFLKRLYVDGRWTLLEITGDYQIGYRQLRKRLQEQNVTFRPPIPRDIVEPATPEMVEAYKRMTLAALARKHHMDPPVMKRRLRLAGVKIRPRGRPRKGEELSAAKEKTPGRETTVHSGDRGASDAPATTPTHGLAAAGPRLERLHDPRPDR